MFRDGSYIDDGCARWVVKTWDTRMVGSGRPAAAAVAIAMSVNVSAIIGGEFLREFLETN